MAGGWLQTGRLPADQAFRWLEEHWDARKMEAWNRATDRWYAALPAFRGSEPPPAPEPPED